MINQKAKSQNALRQKILSDKAVRRAVVRRSHRWFFSIFLSHYVEHETALFHQEMFRITEDKKCRLAVIMAFRGSGKSTIMNLSYSLWAILGVQQKKFILIISKTQNQAKTHFLNIRDELKMNTLLAKDLGPFEADDITWGVTSLVLPKMGARITVASREQAVRGVRFWQHRPDLIICDDLEDSASVQSKTDRDAMYAWFMSEVMPAGGAKTKIIVLGNLLGDDSLLMRLRSDILENRIDGVFKAYPLLDDGNQILWPGKYASMESIDKLKKNMPDEQIWKREYLLEYMPEVSLIRLAKIRDGKLKVETQEPHRLGRYLISAPIAKSMFKIFADQATWNSSGPPIPPHLTS